MNHKSQPYFDAGENTTAYFHEVQSKYNVNTNPLLSRQSPPFLSLQDGHYSITFHGVFTFFVV